MRNVIRILILSAFVCAFWASAGTGASNAAAPRDAPKVVKRPIAFQVTNVNRSALSCASDGAAYTVKGHLVEPAPGPSAAQNSARSAVTLYLHDWSFGEFFWSFTAVPRYDYAAAMARAGHASVVVDRLGYGASGHPQGEQTCLGAQADVAHQIVAALRSGNYAVTGGEAHRFERVALAGHSVGGLIASIEAFSFNDVDALLAIGHTTNVTHQAFDQFYEARVVCGQGGEASAVGGPGGYGYIGQTDAEFEASVFHDSAPAVRAAATRLRARDPCGDSASIVDALVLEVKSLSRVKVPALLVCGREDAVTPSFTCPYLKRRFTGSRDVSLSFVRNAGHALTLERSAPTFRRRVAAWLTAHGL